MMSEVIPFDQLKPGLKPAGHRVLVYVAPTLRKTAGGIVIPDDVAKKDDMRQVRAQVVSVGATAWIDTPGHATHGNPAKPGDMVRIAQFAGHRVTGNDGVSEYRIINDLDITLIEE